jgi:hypothetical protein
MSGQLLKREVKTIASSTLTGTAQNFGAITAISTYKVAFVNAGTVDVEISDGTGQNAFYLPASSTLSVGEGMAQEGKAINIQAVFSNKTQLTILSASGSGGTSGEVVATLMGDL